MKGVCIVYFVSAFGERASVPRLSFGFGRIWVMFFVPSLNIHYMRVVGKYIMSFLYYVQYCEPSALEIRTSF
jgi:hypothetical protein